MEQNVDSAKPAPGRKTIVETLIFPEGAGGAESVDLQDSDNQFKVMEENFHIIDKIAEGGQGKILRAKDRFLNRMVIVKSLKASPMVEATNAKAFVDEAKLTAQLDHPSIIPVYSVNTDYDSQPCFAMKLVNGITLSQYLDEVSEQYELHGIDKFDERMSLANRLECFLKICDAITYAHKKGVIHRDLKPDNIMIGEFHEVYVMDWGIAAVVPEDEESDADEAPTKDELIIGTPGYIDPENIEDATPHPQADVFALGMILYEMVTLQEGVLGDNMQQMIFNILEGKQQPVDHKFGQHIDPDLAAIVDRARAAHRRFRYGSVEELAADVRRHLCNNEVTCRPDNLPRKVRRWIQHHLHQSITVGLGLVLVFALLAVYSLYQQNQAIKRAKVRELAFTQFQADVARQAHVLDVHFLHLAHLLTRTGDKLVWSLENPLQSAERIYSSADFTSDPPPPGTVHSPACNKDINLEHPVYVLAPGVKLKDVWRYVRTITGQRDVFLTTLLSSSFDYSPDRIDELKKRVVETGLPIKWIYAGFESGYFVSFPGKGNYPPNFNPCKRPWYVQGKERQGIHWAAPYYDVSGQGIVLPCTYRLSDEQGKFLGVAALDITLDYLTTRLMDVDEKTMDSIQEKTILDPQGRILISTRLQERNKRGTVLSNRSLKIAPYPEDKIRRQILTRKNGQISRTTEDHEFIYVFAEIQSLGWFYLEKIEVSGL